MKKEFKPMSWQVVNFNCNTQTIEYYDVLAYRDDYIKKMKKKCATKEEFAVVLKREFMYHYWSRSEYELIIRLTDDGRVTLRPWCGCRNDDEAEIDVTDREDFDWKGFAQYHIGKQVYENAAKIDVYDQLQWKQLEFIDYCWNYRHKWQRRNKDEL